ncbi:MAG: exodeoxyribonuclease VII large subunit [Dongiaceae bacterium]
MIDRPISNVPEYSVGEISRAVKGTLEEQFGRIRVRGEIGRLSKPQSGHIYATLKDADDTGLVLDAVIWRSTVPRLAMAPEEGMEVIATGRITTYAGKSSYQLIIESLEIAGEGALLKLIEERRRKLAAEGLFDEDRKKPLPMLPEVIGVVTSLTGAVIRDIRHRLADRFPRQILIWPVMVQGEGAAAQIAAAIAGFNRLVPGGAVPRPDLLIVARGGGSLEDLMAFNEEIVVRAAAASTIPLISAVGHETDWTLIDHAADRRAPTPSAAAEMAVPVRAELMANTAECGHRLMGAMTRWITWRRDQLQGLARGLPDPRRLLQELTQRLDDWMERLAATRVDLIARRRERLANLAGSLRTPDQLIALKGQALGHALERLQAGLERDLTARRHRFDRTAAGLRPGLVHDRLARGREALATAAGLLNSLSYENVLQRGFVLAMGPDGRPVTMAASVDPGMALTLQFRDGKVRTRAEGRVADDGSEAKGDFAAKRASKPSKRSGGDGSQGSLL